MRKNTTAALALRFYEGRLFDGPVFVNMQRLHKCCILTKVDRAADGFSNKNTTAELALPTKAEQAAIHFSQKRNGRLGIAFLRKPHVRAAGYRKNATAALAFQFYESRVSGGLAFAFAKTVFPHILLLFECNAKAAVAFLRE